MSDLDANFNVLLGADVPTKDYVDVSATLNALDDGYKFEILGYWNHKPILYRMDQYICVLGSKKKLLLINTDYDGLTKHGHLRILTDNAGHISLSTVKYIFEDCLKKHKYPNSNYCWQCVVRLTDDEKYLEYLHRKKKRMKDKTKYINTHK